MKNNFSISYKGIQLRPLKKQDIEQLRHWRNMPENCLYLKKIPYLTKQMQEEWFDTYVKNEEELIFAIIEEEKLHRLVGSLALYDFNGNECYFGKILIGDEKAHGQGVGVRAVVAAKEIAFSQLGIERVLLNVYSANVPAVKVYLKAGFSITETHFDSNGNEEYTMIAYMEK